jgi:hypothetical protein
MVSFFGYDFQQSNATGGLAAGSPADESPGAGVGARDPAARQACLRY